MKKIINIAPEGYKIIFSVLVVWIIQIVWSKFWLNHYKQGPLEWFWRKLTYINGKN